MSNLNSITVQSISGVTNLKREYITVNNKDAPIIELYIKNHENKLFTPIVKDEITWETSRKDSPSKLSFTVLKDNTISFNEGSAVIFKFNGKGVFYGFVFEKTRDKEHHIKVTAYDQTRYLKNKHTYIYKNKTASELVKMISADFGLITGNIQDTKYKIGLRIEDNTPLIDIIQFALSETCLNTGNIFTMYDDFGKLALCDLNTLRINDMMINGNSTQNFDYKTTIDSNVYNKIVLYKDVDKQRQFFISQDKYHINRWGLLQSVEQLNDGDNPTNKASVMLSLFNRISRTLTLKNVLGDLRLRAGAIVYCYFDLGDIILNKLMLVENAKHKFSNQEYTVDLLVSGFEY